MTGPKPKPTLLKVLNGNPGKRPLNQREPKPTGDLKDPPDHFSQEQTDIWNYAIAHAPKGLLKNIDLSVLEIWTTSFALYREAERLLKQAGPTVSSPNGLLMPHPSIAIMNKQAGNMMKAAAEMGFTPSSRSRIAVDPEVEADDPWAALAAQG